MMSLCKLSSRALQSVQLERRELSLCCRAGEAAGVGSWTELMGQELQAGTRLQAEMTTSHKHMQCDQKSYLTELLTK